VTTQLGEMFHAQWKLQRESFGVDPLRMHGEERMEYIRMNFIAIIKELGELLDETGWKPWASSNHVNCDLAVGEGVDAWHLFMNLMLAVSGIEIAPDSDGRIEIQRFVDHFVMRYFGKNEVNAQRQEDGYDGVSSKCPVCKRELTESGLIRNPDFKIDQADKSQRFACGGCGAVLPVGFEPPEEAKRLVR
jgi:dimeric dUTPase (all-alpha-NTP-PPase superfamily)